MKLIFIEGVSGVGKTTMSERLQRVLNDMGFSAACYLEGSDNPIAIWRYAYFSHAEFEIMKRKYSDYSDVLTANSTFEEDYVLVPFGGERAAEFPRSLRDTLQSGCGFYKTERYVSLEQLNTVIQDRWRRFLTSYSPDDYAIFDGAFLAHPINDMLYNQQASDEQILQHYQALLPIIQFANPTIFYLSTTDIAKRLRKANVSRGQDIATDEQVTRWEVRKTKDLMVINNINVPARIFDVSEDNWNDAIGKILQDILAQHTV